MGKNIPHNTIRDYSKDDRAPYHLEHLNGFNPIPPKYNFLLRKNMFISLSPYKTFENLNYKNHCISFQSDINNTISMFKDALYLKK